MVERKKRSQNQTVNEIGITYMNKMKLKLINVKILFSLSIVIVLFFISMALPANCASVDTDTVQNLYDVASSGHNSIGQRYGKRHLFFVSSFMDLTSIQS